MPHAHFRCRRDERRRLRAIIIAQQFLRIVRRFHFQLRQLRSEVVAQQMRMIERQSIPFHAPQQVRVIRDRFLGAVK